MCRACTATQQRAYYRANREACLAYQKEYAKKNPEKVSAYKKDYRARLGHQVLKDRDLRWRYGITLEDYETIAREQHGCCAICETRPKTLFVDHCHNTGRVRGLLCSHCNTGIGYLAEDPKRFHAAIAYLEVA